MNSPVIALVAGEASGDTLGAALIRSLRARIPGARFVGIGGPKMVGAGMETWFPQERLAVRGLVEVLRHLRELGAIRRELKRRILAAKPALFVGIDAPDFNLGLARALKRSGVPTAHYVSPSVWAWRAGRIRKIRRSISHMLVLFPFEEQVYRDGGVPVTYVGHPLADEIPEADGKQAAREQLRLASDRPVLAILPGSRQGELEQMAPPFVGAAKLLAAARPDLQFLVPFATRETREIFERELYVQDARELPVSLLFGHAHQAMMAADVVLVASGTATLEAALLKRPMVIAYRLTPLTWRIAKRLVRLPYVGLPNILAAQFIVPELLQDDATPANLAQAVGNLLHERRIHASLLDHFEQLHRTLKRDAAERAADALVPYVFRRAATGGRPADLRTTQPQN